MTLIRHSALLALFSTAVFAQTFRGDIVGRVSDSSGAAISGAVVKLASPSTGLSRSGVTSPAGEFTFAELPVGLYEVTVEAPGFEVKKINNVTVEVAKTSNLPVQLGVTQQQSVVEVSASAAALETTSSSLVALVDDKSVQEMPMNGRDFTQMVKLAPGVTPSGASINGLRTNAKNFQ